MRWMLAPWTALLGIGLGTSAFAAEPVPPGIREGREAAAHANGICHAARVGLEALWARVPGAQVTSGRRTREDEARAFADNIAQRRGWMRILKASDTPALVLAQAWIDAHWKSVRGRPAPIAEHLAGVFAGLSDVEMARISPHFGGSAVDLRKRPGIGRRVLRALPNAVQVLDEGDHWHVGFRCAEPFEE